MITSTRNIVRVAAITGLLLLVPFVATLMNPNATVNGGVGGGFDWGAMDFVIMGALLFVTGLSIDFAIRKIQSPLHRVIACIGIIFALVLIWAELAVDGVSQLVAILVG